MSGLDDVDLLANQLMSYFGDSDSAEAIASIRKDIQAHSGTRRAFHEGLDRVLGDPGFDCIRLVRDCANRRADSELEARAWLRNLKDELTRPSSAHE